MDEILLQVLLGGLLSIGLFSSSLLVCADSFLLHTLIHQILGGPDHGRSISSFSTPGLGLCRDLTTRRIRLCSQASPSHGSGRFRTPCMPLRSIPTYGGIYPAPCCRFTLLPRRNLIGSVFRWTVIIGE